MKCRRCNSTVISITGETCMCGEPLATLYYPKEGEFRHNGAKRRSTDVAIPRALNGERDLLNEIRRFCAKYSFPHTSFGRRFFNDAYLVERLCNGAMPRQATVERIRAAMRDYENGNTGTT